MFTRLISALFAIFLIVCPLFAHAAENTLLDKTISIGWWHNATAYYKFSANGLSEAALTITNITPEQYYRGWMAINGKWYQLDNEASFSCDITLKESNRIFVAFFGAPDTRLNLKVAPPGPPAPEVIAFTALPETIAQGEVSTLSWETENAELVTIEPDIGPVDVNGIHQVVPGDTTTYTIVATGPGGTATGRATVNVIWPAPEVSITAEPDSISYGNSATLSWASTNAETLIIDNGVGDVTTSGSLEVSPEQPTTFTITANGPGGTATADASVSVTYVTPEVSFSATPAAIRAGGRILLEWTTTGATTCSIEPDIGNVALNGAKWVYPTQSTTYTITAGTPDPNAVATAAVSVIVNQPPRVNLSISDEVINYGDTVTLTWSAAPAQKVIFNHGIGQVAPSGSMLLTPEYTTTHTMTAVNTTDDDITSVNHTISVKVLGNPPDSQPEGTFGAQYNDLIPEDASLEYYDPERFVVVTGLVNDINGNPLPDVTASIIDHPEYGTAKTDETGRYAIPAEGGCLVKLCLDKTGYLKSHRKKEASVLDVIVMDTVTLLSRDPAATVINFDGNPETVMTHQSTEVSDEFGTRKCTMVFTGDNQAYSLDEYGNVLTQLSSITTRATEYEIPASMPAILPPTSAYTYCVELEANGFERIKFDKPAICFVDNFLNFDVGTIVPVGYYDFYRTTWVASENGQTVMLLDTDSDGNIDALDADGDNLPDDIDNDGLTADEVAGLDTDTCLPGATYWRFSIDHFSTVDCNFPYGPPEDATIPGELLLLQIDNLEELPKACPTPSGSYVNDRSRIMQEDIPIQGTGMTLHYASNRVIDYKTVIDVPASGDSVPASLKEIIVKCEIAGHVWKKTLAAWPDQKATFIWNGLDFLGRPVKTAVEAHFRIGYVYDGVYYETEENKAFAFAQAGDLPTFIETREELVYWTERKIRIYRQQAISTDELASGWTISSHHHQNLSDLSTLHKGDGSKIKNNIDMITTVAGKGGPTYKGDGGPATEAYLYGPEDIAIDSQGNLYIADTHSNCIRKVDINGIITTFAGEGGAIHNGLSGDGGPATEARLYEPKGVAVDDQGNLYIADTRNNRVRRVDANGIITTVAGKSLFKETGDYSGDGGPAIAAELHWPMGLALDHEGNLFIADRYNHCVRKVDTSGIISTVAGTGAYGYSGDGGPATEARFEYVDDVAIDNEGNLLIADSGNNRIRKLDASGIVTTVVGTGAWYCLGGDGGPATEAIINSPHGMVVDNQGNLFFSDTGNECIRRVDNCGIIATISGPGPYAYLGDDDTAIEAGFINPRGLEIDSQGNILVADCGHNRIRKIGPPSIFSTSTNSGDVSFADENGLGYIIDSTGQHKKTIALNTGTTLLTFSYDTFEGQPCLTSITDRFNRVTLINRYSDGTPYSIVSPDGLDTLLSVDANNHLDRITQADEGIYDFIYSAGGLLTKKTEPETTHVYNYRYNENGRLTDTYDNRGGHWNFGRYIDEQGRAHTRILTAENNLTTYVDQKYSTGRFASTITGPSGGTTYYNESAGGLTVQKEMDCGMNLDFIYDVDPEYRYKFIKEMTESTPSGLVRSTQKNKDYQDTNDDEAPDIITQTVTMNGKTAQQEADLLASVITIDTPEDRTLISTFDPDTLQTTSTRTPGFNPTVYAYYTDGRLASISTGARKTSFFYDPDGYLDAITDPNHNTTNFENDKAGRILNIDRPDTTSLDFSYDNNGNMIVLTNPSDVDHGFSFNEVDLPDAYDTPLSGSYRFVYDKDRRLIRKDFPSGKSIYWDYADPMNSSDKSRLWQIQTPEYNIDYTYTCGSKIDTVTKDNESINYSYDGRLITSETLAGTLDQTLARTYNNDFNLSSLTYAGATENCAYDNDGLLTGAGDFVISRFNDPGINETGLPYHVSNGNFSLNRSFNGYGETSSENAVVNSQDVCSWNVFARYDDGRIKTKTETIGGVTTTLDYTYDPLGRLATVTKDGSLVEAYDYTSLPYGTCTYQMNTQRGVAGRSLDYDDEDHLLSTGGASYQYDLDGFLQSKTTIAGTTGYDYSSRGELLSVDLPDGTAIEYIYDSLGRRIAKKVDGIIIEKYLWSGLTTLLAVYDGADNLLMRFKYADSRMPVGLEKAGVVYYLTYDQVGSLRAVADASGDIVKQIDYDSFGYVLNDTNPGFEVPFGFAGGLCDRDTGLVRFGYRDYDPDTGRWTAKDPIGFAGGDSDLYGYCLNDPINLIDPYGLVKWGSVFQGGFAMVTGGFAVWFGSAASATGIGAIGGVPAVIGGAATFGWGMTEFITGFLDSETDIATPCTASLTTLVITGDMEAAKKADLAQDIIFLGCGWGNFLGSPPTNSTFLEFGGKISESVYVAGESTVLDSGE